MYQLCNRSWDWTRQCFCHHLTFSVRKPEVHVVEDHEASEGEGGTNRRKQKKMKVDGTMHVVVSIGHYTPMK